MEEVVVTALSSSSVFNSKQWQLQQHDLLLIQQRQQLEQLKKEQEELKSRLRRYGKVTLVIENDRVGPIGIGNARKIVYIPVSLPKWRSTPNLSFSRILFVLHKCTIL